MNRRDWLKASSAVAGASLLLGREASALESANSTLESLYTPRPLAEYIRLSANENSYGPSPAAREAMAKYWDEANRYFSAGVQALRDVIAAEWGVPKEYVLITQGSSEGLAATAAAYAIGGGEMISADPTYDSLVKYGQGLGATITKVPVDPVTLSHDLPAMEAKVSAATKLMFICNPNNPTGTLVGGAQLRPFCERVSQKAVVFVDEAYHDFVEDPTFESMLSLVRLNANVIVSRTASKIHGMAGLRIGFLMAKPEILQKIRPMMMGFPNAMAARATIAAVQDKPYQQFIRQQNKTAREMVYTALDAAKLPYVKSHGNFVFFNAGRPVQQVQKAFMEKGIMVGRPFPPLLQWCRVSTGTPEEMRRFTDALRVVMA
jgi:histidinol-phosphate aminotransferase